MNAGIGTLIGVGLGGAVLGGAITAGTMWALGRKETWKWQLVQMVGGFWKIRIMPPIIGEPDYWLSASGLQNDPDRYKSTVSAGRAAVEHIIGKGGKPEKLPQEFTEGAASPPLEES